MAFSPDSRLLLFEGNGAVGAYQTASRRLLWMPVAAPIQAIAFLGQGSVVAVAAGSGTTGELTVAQPPDLPALRVPVPTGSSLSSVDGQLLLCVPALPQGNPAQLLRVDLELR